MDVSLLSLSCFSHPHPQLTRIHREAFPRSTEIYYACTHARTLPLLSPSHSPPPSLTETLSQDGCQTREAFSSPLPCPLSPAFLLLLCLIPTGNEEVLCPLCVKACACPSHPCSVSGACGLHNLLVPDLETILDQCQPVPSLLTCTSAPRGHGASCYAQRAGGGHASAPFCVECCEGAAEWVEGTGRLLQ